MGDNGGHTYLVFGGVIQQGVVALTVAVVAQVIVDEVPAPALVVAAQQRYVAGLLERRRACADSNDSGRPQRSLPPHLPAVSARTEARLAASAVRTLRHRVAVYRESVALHVDVPRTVVNVPRVIESTQFRFVRGNAAENVRTQRLLGKPFNAVQSPDVIVLVVQ